MKNLENDLNSKLFKDSNDVLFVIKSRLELVFSTGFPKNLTKKFKFELQIVDFQYVLNENSRMLPQILKISTFLNSGQV